jgi:small conductance mechanosensitive channel
LALGLTALLLLIWGIPDAVPQETAVPAAEVARDPIALDPADALEEATATLRDLLRAFYAFLPKFIIVLLLLVVAGLVSRLFRKLLNHALGSWERREALSALARIGFFLAAVAAGLTVLAGDIRALLGSIGLIGLALSWALQTPIESFTGWLINSFQGYYRVGDRIEVGEVFGDVYKIDVLTTTVWEAGGPGKPVAGAQSTGALITFPNWEVLRSNIINYTRDFPYVWDEVTVGVANESDLFYTMQIVKQVSMGIVGEQMKEPVRQYANLLEQQRLSFEVAEEPAVFFSLTDAWTNCTIRYLVHARARRKTATNLIMELSRELASPEHRGRIISGGPRTEVHLKKEAVSMTPGGPGGAGATA